MNENDLRLINNLASLESGLNDSDKNKEAIIQLALNKKLEDELIEVRKQNDKSPLSNKKSLNANEFDENDILLRKYLKKYSDGLLNSSCLAHNSPLVTNQNKFQNRNTFQKIGFYLLSLQLTYFYCQGCCPRRIFFFFFF